VVAAVRDNLPPRCVIDGEIVLPYEGRLDFDRLSERIHPADSRVRMLAEQFPAGFVAFDILALDDVSLLGTPQTERRTALEGALAGASAPVHLAPSTTDPELAREWFERYEGAGLDGVVAKPLDLPYRPDTRVMYKIKHERTADCVVAGYRFHKSGPVVGSLLLGLYDSAGVLHHVGIASSFKQTERAKLAELLKPMREGAREDHPWRDWAEFQDQETAQRLPGATSRWNRGKDLSWEPIKIGLVCEVSYDHLQGTRFRHATHFKRWRPDKPATDCRYDQLEETPAFLISEIFGGR
jgi:ATP-dependent DNA ligase